jgi:hypothetical protein
MIRGRADTRILGISCAITVPEQEKKLQDPDIIVITVKPLFGYTGKVLKETTFS